MSGDILEFSVGGPRVIVANQPEATTTTVVATYAQGFGHDPAHAPGVAHLHEHLFLSALRTTMRDPLVVQAQTHADRTRVTATVLAGAEKALVVTLASAATTLAEGRVDESVLARECRAIDVELSECITHEGVPVHVLIVVDELENRALQRYTRWITFERIAIPTGSGPR